MAEKEIVPGNGRKTVKVQKYEPVWKRCGTLTVEKATIQSTEDAVDVFRTHFDGAMKEQFAVMLIDLEGHVTGLYNVTVGDLTQVQAPVRETFIGALMGHAHSVILAHNHLGSDAQPSESDCNVHKQMNDAGNLIGIPVLASFVIAQHGDFTNIGQYMKDKKPCNCAACSLEQQLRETGAGGNGLSDLISLIGLSGRSL